MSLRGLLLGGLCLLVACANQERDPRERASDSPAARTSPVTLSMEEREALIALVPGMPAGGCLMLLWGGPVVSPSESHEIVPAVYGSNRDLHLCSLKCYNFSERPIDFPSMADLRLEVSMNGRAYPLKPLEAFASEFPHPRTLAMLDGEYPDSDLPGRSWTRIYLACRIPDYDPNRNRPESLVLADNSRVPWVPVKRDELNDFLKEPRAGRLEGMVEKASLVLGATHETER